MFWEYVAEDQISRFWLVSLDTEEYSTTVKDNLVCQGVGIRPARMNDLWMNPSASGSTQICGHKTVACLNINTLRCQIHLRIYTVPLSLGLFWIFCHLVPLCLTKIHVVLVVLEIAISGVIFNIQLLCLLVNKPTIFICDWYESIVKLLVLLAHLTFLLTSTKPKVIQAFENKHLKKSLGEWGYVSTIPTNSGKQEWFHSEIA